MDGFRGAAVTITILIHSAPVVSSQWTITPCFSQNITCSLLAWVRLQHSKSCCSMVKNPPTVSYFLRSIAFCYSCLSISLLPTCVWVNPPGLPRLDGSSSARPVLLLASPGPGWRPPGGTPAAVFVCKWGQGKRSNIDFQHSVSSLTTVRHTRIRGAAQLYSALSHSRQTEGLLFSGFIR